VLPAKQSVGRRTGKTRSSSRETVQENPSPPVAGTRCVNANSDLGAEQLSLFTPM